MTPSQLAAPDELTESLLAHAAAATGFMPEDEGAALHEAAAVAASEGPEPLIEIGAYCGKSTLYLAAAVWRASLAGEAPPSLVYSLDHHHGSSEQQAGWEHHDTTLVDPRTGRMDTLPSWRRTIEDAGAEDLVAGLVGESSRIARAWTTPLRFVFIDGGHGKKIAWADYRGWSPKVTVGGMLAIHDVFENPEDGGRPPFEIYHAALASQHFDEDRALCCGSLRVLRRLR
jgi:predicted O-methyltransferase YrrM